MGNNFSYEIASFQELKAITEETMPGKTQDQLSSFQLSFFANVYRDIVGNFKRSLRVLSGFFFFFFLLTKNE